MNNWALVVVVGALLLGGCSTVPDEPLVVNDPYESLNRDSYEFSDAIDRAVLVPVARGYQRITPDPVEQGITNFFANLNGVANSANGFLQGKPKSGAQEFGRFLVNSTLGVVGIFDVATKVGLESHPEDFGQTLAVWGWRESSYVYVPFLGPSTVRDLPTTFFRGYIPRLLLGSSYHWSMTGVDVINTRASLLSVTETRDASALDGYTFTKDGFIQRRQYLIYDGDIPYDDLFDDFEEDFDDEEFEEDPAE